MDDRKFVDLSVERALRRRRPRLAIAVVMVVASTGFAAKEVSPWIVRETGLWLAGREIAQGRLDEAEGRLALMVREEPTRTRARLLYVGVLRRKGQVTEAQAVLQRTVELGLPVEDARREYALLHAWEDFPGVEKSLRKLIDARPDDREVRQALDEGHERARRAAKADRR